MRKSIVFMVIAACFLSGCASSGVNTSDSTLPANARGGGGPAAEEVKISDIRNYQIRFNRNYGDLLPVELDGTPGFLSDYPIDLNYLIDPDMTLELATTGDELYRLDEVPDLNSIIHSLVPDARVGEFIASEQHNMAVCRVPLDIQSGEELYCGFQFSYVEKTYIVLVLATTQRDLEKPDVEPTRIHAPPWER